VQVIDNIERNHRLGLVSEFAVGKGRLVICMSDLEGVQDYPEGRQFYHSLLRYMQGGEFLPNMQISWMELWQKLTGEVEEKRLQELNNISPY
jgi:hypothetical protein